MQMGLKNLVHLYSKRKKRKRLSCKSNKNKVGETFTNGQLRRLATLQIPVWRADFLPLAPWFSLMPRQCWAGREFQEPTLSSAWRLYSVQNPLLGHQGLMWPLTSSLSCTPRKRSSRSGWRTLGRSYMVYIDMEQLTPNLLKEKEKLWIHKELWTEPFPWKSAKLGSFY